ncbi:putative SH3 domain protein [Gigaspora margarita]|uniref:Putative SH3 domain protein n=1 Tax=Gigaspora margarita TaxID=4874 RepID=A0A8H4ENL4_GIGMA|nr:putative SH3 domain protein [Gigaspora margarita]
MQREHNLSIDTNSASYVQETTNSEDSQSSPMTDDDIDFGLVYASRTFRETVEGRVKVERGDSLILLDDSNDYWWLVKLLKNDEVGYMPAEDIEMPSEKLARINKHKNVDLTIPKNIIEENNLSLKQKKTKNKSVYFTTPECFVWEEESENEYVQEIQDIQDIQEIQEVQEVQEVHEVQEIQEIEEQKIEITNQENVEVQKVQKFQIIVDEPEEMDIQDTESATPTSQKVEIVSEQTSISARDDTEPNILGITISSPVSQTDQQNDDDKSNKIKTRKQTGIFNYDIMKIDSSNFTPKTPDISIQSPETLMSDLGSDFIDFSDDDDEPRIITRFFGKSSPADDLIKSPIESSDDKKNNKGRKEKEKEKEKKDGIFKNFFKRKKKKDDILLNTNKSSLNDQLQMGSSKQLLKIPMSPKSSAQRRLRRPSVTKKASSDATYSVLHIYTGQNIPTNFKYKICLLSQKTTTAALIKQAIHRFKLNDENWGNYFISMKEINREERHLMPHDHPLEIFNSIVSYHSTPLPPSIKRTSTLSISSNFSNISNNEAINRLQIHDNQEIVSLYLNKRSKLKEQKLRIRILAYSDDLPVNYQIKKSSTIEGKPIEKKLVVAKNTTISQIIENAMDKFGITNGIADDEKTFEVNDERPRYRLYMLVDGEEKPIDQKTDIASAYPSKENLRRFSVSSVGSIPLESDHSLDEPTFVLRLSKSKKIEQSSRSKEYEKTILSEDFGFQDLLARVRTELSIAEMKQKRNSGWHFQDPEKILEQIKPTEIRKDVWSIFENVNNELDRLESELNQILIDVIRVF